MAYIHKASIFFFHLNVDSLQHVYIYIYIYIINPIIIPRLHQLCKYSLVLGEYVSSNTQLVQRKLGPFQVYKNLLRPFLQDAKQGGSYVVDSFLAFSCLLHLLIWILKTKRFLRHYWNGRNFCWHLSSDLPYLQSKEIRICATTGALHHFSPGYSDMFGTCSQVHIARWIRCASIGLWSHQLP